MEKIKQELTSINKIMLDSKMPKGQINFLKQRVDLLTSKGFTNIELKKDMFGVDRMIKAIYTS